MSAAVFLVSLPRTKSQMGSSANRKPVCRKRHIFNGLMTGSSVWPSALGRSERRSLLNAEFFAYGLFSAAGRFRQDSARSAKFPSRTANFAHVPERPSREAESAALMARSSLDRKRGKDEPSQQTLYSFT
jgi:hypothetical protein